MSFWDELLVFLCRASGMDFKNVGKSFSNNLQGLKAYELEH